MKLYTVSGRDEFCNISVAVPTMTLVTQRQKVPELTSPCPMLALSYEERQQFTHHSIHMSLARRSSRHSPASKNVQGEPLPPSKGKVLLYLPPQPPSSLFLCLPWEVTGHSCPAHGRMSSGLPCVSRAKQWQE